MPALLVLIFLFVMELTVIIQVGGQIGALTTVFLVIATAVVGLSIIARQGMSTMQRLQLAQIEGRSPAVEIIEAVMLVFAAIFLLVPGFISDTLGFLLLTPLRGQLAKTTVGRWVGKQSWQGGRWQFKNDGKSSDFTVVEGEFTEIQEKNHKISK